MDNQIDTERKREEIVREYIKNVFDSDTFEVYVETLNKTDDIGKALLEAILSTT